MYNDFLLKDRSVFKNFYTTGWVKAGENKKLQLNRVTFSGNSAYWGAGIYCSYADMILANVAITNNSVSNSGGGINCYYVNGTLTNVTISNNRAGNTGGGICAEVSPVAIVNSILWNNSPDQVTEGDIFYSDIMGGWPGMGNIDADPMFIDSADGNYRLQAGSPCIDAGIQDVMIIYNNGRDTLIVPPIPHNGHAPDMGAYESPYISAINEDKKIADKFVLQQNYPNPFNPTTKIRFLLPYAEHVKIEIFNLLGQSIETLMNKPMPAGSYEIKFTAYNLPSGVYIYKIEAGEFIQRRKMILLK